MGGPMSGRDQILSDLGFTGGEPGRVRSLAGRTLRSRVGRLLLRVAPAAAVTMVASGCNNWPAFMFGPDHTSINRGATAITTANAANLVKKWQFMPDPPTMAGQPAARLEATPVTYNGVVYVGAESGVFYAVSELTGKVLWKQFLGFSTGTCATMGIESTATVAPDPQTGNPTVYVGSGNGYVYALNAANGTVHWKRRVALQVPAMSNNPFLWSSPAVANDRVYIGISSDCDHFPDIPNAGVVALDQAKGIRRAAYFTEPPGQTGAGVWSSPAVDPTDGSVFVTTGNPGQSPDLGDGDSILRLNGQTLVRLDKWTVPAAQQISDGDFGASPALFSAPGSGRLVGACNKNGVFYAFRRSALSAGPIWQRQVGTAANDPPTCIAGTAFDGTHLYVGANATTIGGTSYAGSMRALDPATGTPAWEVGLPSNVLGSPTANGSGVVAASTDGFFNSNATRLFNASTGAILNTLGTGAEFAQPVWSDNLLVLATQSNGLQGYGLP
jgi:outer membrane protein assembly factor BamB